MQFIRSDWEGAVAAVSARINDELEQGKRVLWLVSGGSQIESNVRIMTSIPDELSANLTVLPVDERYGPPGHADSNWDKMLAAGFDPKRATATSALKEGLDFEQNIDYFRGLIEEAFAAHDVIIGQLGIGPDGHTSGILPRSPACGETTSLVTGYEAPPLKRLTTTFPALRRLAAAYVLAFGQEKLPALQQLKNEELSLAEQPAQILKDLAEAYVYNDQLEG